jgi:hypothetical protein
MSKGLDTTSNVTQHVHALKALGYTWVGRYTSHSVWKNVTRAEARAISVAGMDLVNVWETAGDRASFFSYEQGLHDGEAAYKFALQLGQPFSAPIYFAVDIDLPGPGEVHEYFRGVRESLGRHGQIGYASFNVGVYGPGAVCEYLLSIGFVSYAWLAQAPGWAGYADFADWNIKQLGSTRLMGMGVDNDVASAKGGGGFTVK